jgi:hypothetical protein
MEGEPVPEKSVDQVLDEIDWAKLGSKGPEDKAELPLPGKSEPLPRTHTEPLLPDQTKLLHHGADIEIVRRWFGWQAVLLTALTALLGWATWSTLGSKQEDGSLFGLVFAAMDVLLAYYTLALWLNRTRIAASRETITVRHGPLPWPGKEVRTTDFKQFNRVGKETRGSKGGRVTLYEVHGLRRDGRSVQLVDGLTGLTSEQAFFIAQQLAEYVGPPVSPGEGGVLNWLHP